MLFSEYKNNIKSFWFNDQSRQAEDQTDPVEEIHLTAATPLMPG
jgi:hypothetical protein